MTEVITMMRQDRKEKSAIDLSSLGQDTWTENMGRGRLNYECHEQAPGAYHTKPLTAKFGWEEHYERTQAER